MNLTNRFAEALGYAERLHRDQKRKGNDIPYVAHLLAVAATVLEWGGDEDTAIAALLHDAVEDQGGLGAPTGAGSLNLAAWRQTQVEMSETPARLTAAVQRKIPGAK